MSDAAILIVPACEKGLGGGHLSRSVYLANKLSADGKNVYIWIHEARKDEVLENFAKLLVFRHTFILSHREELLKHSWDFIIFDNFKTSREDFGFWSAIPGSIPFIGIDEGGPCRDDFDFLLDLLPGLYYSEPNLKAPWLLPLPKNRRMPVLETPESQQTNNSAPVSAPDARPLRILVSFGAEDDAALGPIAAKSLLPRFSSLAHDSTAPHFPAPEITLVTPHHGGSNITELPGVNVTGMIPDLKEHLAEYDLFVTHFGLGAFEAIYAGVPVLILSPTDYHEKLAKNAGFYTMPASSIRRCFSQRHSGADAEEIINSSFISSVRKCSQTIAQRYGLVEDQKEDHASFVSNLAPHAPRICPACGKKSAPVIARFGEESYRRCHYCGIIFLLRLNEPPLQYDSDYFCDTYKKQYGKTYLEDFPALKEMSRKRLAIIKKIFPAKSSFVKKRRHPGTIGRALGLNSSSVPPCLRERNIEVIPSLLDIGCAYGPFMAVAAEDGFIPYGVEPIEDAVRYVKEVLGFTAWQGFFPQALPAEYRNPLIDKNAVVGDSAAFSVITLWYVMEHFRNLGHMLSEIHRLLKDGGVLAFSIPSYSGISGRKSLYAFLQNSPGDHFTIWSPGICKKILRQYGFKLHKIVITGHHPERFPLLGRFVQPGQKGLLYRLLLLISKVFRLGDTFEAYAKKRCF